MLYTLHVTNRCTVILCLDTVLDEKMYSEEQGMSVHHANNGNYLSSTWEKYLITYISEYIIETTFLPWYHFFIVLSLLHFMRQTLCVKS